MTSVCSRIVCHRSIYRNFIPNHLNGKVEVQCNRRLVSNTSTQSSSSGPNTSSRFSVKTVVAMIAVPTAAYMAYTHYRRKEELLNYKEPDVIKLERLPKVPISYKIVNTNDKTNLDLILFQCQTCPFCCKMIAYLNSKGLSYSVVNVDEPFERRVKWSHYKQVPCVLARTKDGQFIELTNSSVIISILAALTNDPNLDIEDLAKMYPKISYMKANGVKKHGIVNKYDLMYKGKLPKGVTPDSIQ